MIPVAHVREEVEYRELADGGMIYDPASQRIHHLNRTAAFIWRLCQQGCSADVMLERLCRDFDVAREQARQDMETMLMELAAADLLRE